MVYLKQPMEIKGTIQGRANGQTFTYPGKVWLEFRYEPDPKKDKGNSVQVFDTQTDKVTAELRNDYPDFSSFLESTKDRQWEPVATDDSKVFHVNLTLFGPIQYKFKSESVGEHYVANGESKYYGAEELEKAKDNVVIAITNTNRISVERFTKKCQQFLHDHVLNDDAVPKDAALQREYGLLALTQETLQGLRNTYLETTDKNRFKETFDAFILRLWQANNHEQPFDRKHLDELFTYLTQEEKTVYIDHLITLFTDHFHKGTTPEDKELEHYGMRTFNELSPVSDKTPFFTYLQESYIAGMGGSDFFFHELALFVHTLWEKNNRLGAAIEEQDVVTLAKALKFKHFTFDAQFTTEQQHLFNKLRQITKTYITTSATPRREGIASNYSLTITNDQTQGLGELRTLYTERKASFTPQFTSWTQIMWQQNNQSDIQKPALDFLISQLDYKPKKEEPTISDDEKYGKDAFIKRVIDILKDHVVGNKPPLDDKKPEKTYKLYGVENIKVFYFRNNYNKAGLDDDYFDRMERWVNQLWEANKKSTEPNLSKDDHEKIRSFLKNNLPKDGGSPNGGDTPGGNGGNGNNQQGSEGLFIYLWWAFPDEETIEYYNDNSMYPRQIGKGSRPLYEENLTKDNQIIEDNEKPSGHATGKFLGMAGLTETEVSFEREKPVAPEILQQNPVIGLGAAIAERHVIEEIFGGSFPHGALSEEQRRRLYQFVDKEELRWKWYWRPLKGERKTAELIVMVTTPDIWEAYKDKPEELIKQDDKGLKDVDVTYTAKQQTLTLKTDKTGKVTLKTLPKGEEVEKLKAQARGYKNDTVVYPGIPFKIEKDKQFAIIVLETDQQLREDPVFLVKPITKEKTHDHPLAKEFGSSKERTVPEGSTAGGKAKGLEMTFYTTKEKSRLLQEDEKLFYELFIRKIDAPNEQDNAWPKKEGHVTIINGKGAGKKIIATGNFNESIASRKWDGGGGNETIVPSFDIPTGATGTYRIYCLAKKSAVPLNKDDLDHVFADTCTGDEQLWDYNYIEFTIGVKEADQTKELSKKTVKETEQLLLDAKSSIGENGTYAFAPKEFLQALDNLLTHMNSKATEIRGFYEKYGKTAQITYMLETAVAAGIYARRTLQKYGDKGGKTDKTSIKTLYTQDKGLKALSTAIPGLSFDVHPGMKRNAALDRATVTPTGKLTVSDVKQYGKKETHYIEYLIRAINNKLTEATTNV